MVQICGWERIREGVRQTPSHFPTKNTRYFSFGSKYGAKDSHSLIPILPLPLPTTRKERARKKFSQRPISQRDLSLFYFERNFFFLTHIENIASKGLIHFYQNFISYPQRESSKQRAFPFSPEFFFLPTARK
jgi:hypothetical protein